MTDAQGRAITYARISLTDQCNMRCQYCNPAGCSGADARPLLSAHAITRLARILATLGITKLRLTGGEPLLRADLADIAVALSHTDGIQTLALTTNGVLFAERAEELYRAGVRSVNISLDAVDDTIFSALTGFPSVRPVLLAIDRALACGYTVKVNAVICKGINESQIVPLAALAQNRPVSVRFIELMPLGFGKTLCGVRGSDVQSVLETAFGKSTPLAVTHSPARYVQFAHFCAPVGFISAVSNAFCVRCNRIRITSDGTLKTCLAYAHGLSLADMLSHASDAVIAAQIEQAVQKKPAGHQFFCADTDSSLAAETRTMVQIGG